MLRFTQRAIFARALKGAALALLLAMSASGAARADAATTTTLSSFHNPSLDGETVRLEALINGGPDGAPAGTVDFTESGTPITGGDDVAISRFGAGHTMMMGDTQACVVTASGGVSCVGNGGFGQNGNNSFQSTNTFADMGLSSVVALALGGLHSCALNSAGNVSCWGHNFNAQLGNPSNLNDSAAPVSIGLSTAAKAIAAGGDFTCALLVGGSVECWGGHLHGQLGNGQQGGYSGGSAPGAVTGVANAKAIAAGGFHACALLDGGTVKCWGMDDNGQVGNNHATDTSGDFADVLTPATVDNLSDVIAIATGGSHTCALVSSGAVKCWGYNHYGTLGNNSTTDSAVPVDVQDSGVTYVALGSGSSNLHNCGITNTGAVRCWGNNAYGQLGNATKADEYVPVSGGFHAANNISLGFGASCAALVGGGAECTGNNQAGQFGLGFYGNGPDSGDPDYHLYILGPVPTVASGELLTYSRAVVTTSALSVGTHNIVASYSGDGGAYSPSDSEPLSQTVSILQQASSIGVVPDVNPSTFGQSVTFTATVTGAGPIPTGDVIFNIDGTNQSPAAITSGTATLTTSSLTAGEHTIKAVYNGDENYFGHTSSDLIQTVKRAPSFTSADNASSIVNSAASFTFTTAAFPVPTITISAGSVPIGMTFGDNGDGTASVTGTPTVFGDVTFSIAAQNTVNTTTQAFTYHVTKNASTITLDATTTKLVGQSVTFTAQVSAGATGTVTFYDNGTSLAVKDLSGTTATHSMSTLPVGDHPISAVYNGDATHFGSTSSTRTQAINKGETTVTLARSPTTPEAGEAVTLNAHVTVKSPAAAALTGTITFKDGSTTLGTGPVGTGSLKISRSFALGSHTITATYGGNSSVHGDSGSTTFNITKTKTTMTLAASPATAKPGQAIKFTAHVTSTGGTPTGTVTFKNGSSSIGSATLSSGNAIVTTGALSLGLHTITASYAGTSTLGDSTASRSVTVTAGVGAEQKVSTRSTGSQQYPAIARLTSGYVAVWESTGQDGAGFGVYGQRYKSDFTKSGSEFRVNTTTTGQQFSSRVAALTDGGFVVTYQSQSSGSSDYNIYAQRYKSTGGKSGSELHVNTATTGLQSAPAVAGTSDGGFVVTFESPDGSGKGIGIYARAYSKTSTPKAVARVNTTTTGDQAFVDVAGLLNGGYVVTWSSANVDGSGTAIVSQRYTAANAKSGSEVRVNTTKTGDQLTPSIAELSDGGHVATWVSDGQDGSSYGVYMQRYSKTGEKVGTEHRVNTTTAGDQWEPAVSGFATGGFLVLWSSAGQDGDGYGVYAQVFDADGARVQGEFKVNSFTTGNQWHPAVAGFNNGEAVGIWTSDSQDGSGAGIYSQRLQMPGVTPPPKK